VARPGARRVPLGGVRRLEAARLDECRLAAVEGRLDAELQLDRRAELVPELEELVARHPLRERFAGQLMTALYRAGRQAEALRTFASVRIALVEELGIGVSPGCSASRPWSWLRTPPSGPTGARRPRRRPT
jgi:DNA-binding SARP family transcriptional activator